MKFISTLSVLPFVLVINKNMARGPPFWLIFSHVLFFVLFFAVSDLFSYIDSTLFLSVMIEMMKRYVG